MDLTSDTVLHNRYRLIRQLGQGGMGAVYLALDTTLEHEVAVKVNRNPSPQSTSQFLREARLLATLRHPNLPRVTDYFLKGEEQFLVMDYIPGDDLGTLLARQGPQPLNLVLEWTRQLNSALAYLHSQNPPVIHRDIKPANIKLTPDGEVILVDFGIAKASETSQATATGAAGYTPGYAPPEQYGSGRTGPYSDEYSLAATLYHLLTGHKPVDSVQRLLQQESLPPLRSYLPGIPANIEGALERALDVRAENRFANMDQFQAALNDPTFLYSAPTANIATVAAAAQTQAAPPVIRPAGEQTPTRPPSAHPVEEAHKGISGWVWGLIGGGVVILFLLVVGVAAGVFFFGRNGNGKASATPVPQVALAENTPEAPPTGGQPAQDTPQPSDTPEPAQPSETPFPTDTLEPSATPTATITPTATETQPPVGNGGLVVFSSDRADGKTLQLWSMRINYINGAYSSSDLTQLTFDEGDKTQPAWSPDGKRILYVASGGKDEKNNDLGLDIWVINADGSGTVDLTRRKGDDTDPTWSSDGSAIAYTNNGREDKIRQIYTMKPTGKDFRRISYDLDEYDPTWSPDMKWLAFVGFVNSNHILYLRSRGAEPQVFYSTQTPVPFDRQTIFTNLGQVDDPAWSPDGTWLAYTRLDTNNKNRYVQLAKYVSRGGTVVKLESSGRDYSPNWSPDSNWLLFTSERDDNQEIYLMNVSGQFQTNLTNNPARDLDAAWQPLAR